MVKGREFLQAQVNNAAMQHKTLLENLKDHQKQAKDPRYRELCAKHAGGMQEHQRMLEEYAKTVGEGGGRLKAALGTVLGKMRDVADAARGDDFLRLVGDIVTIRQAQDIGATFAAVGDQLNEPRMTEIGKALEKDHDAMQRAFNALSHKMFVENVQSP